MENGIPDARASGFFVFAEEPTVQIEDRVSKIQESLRSARSSRGSVGGFFVLRSFIFILAGAAVALAAAACRPTPAPDRATPPTAAPPARIISLAPSVTEVLFALGLGDRVVGVTSFCRYPPEVARLPKVGGYLDLNLEAIVGLDPDLVVLIQDHDAARARLETLGIPTLQVDQRDLDGILRSIVDIAERCGVGQRGGELVAEIRARLDDVEQRVAGLPRPRTLAVVGREAGSGTLTTVWVAGTETFYDDVIRLAGGVNAAAPSPVLYPELSREGLLHIDPDVILDLLADLDDRGVAAEAAAADWQQLAPLRAARSGRVHLIEHELTVVPGPRVADLVEEVAQALHPEAVR
jgi:iron complex transport system substrate-binding protein